MEGNRVCSFTFRIILHSAFHAAQLAREEIRQFLSISVIFSLPPMKNKDDNDAIMHLRGFHCQNLPAIFLKIYIS
ncbi:hypothetical protein PUN28_002687 [Cardiocondyla obscurior]|uniref:Uncharacterized protein n=1 Tax=Cardiocondyla obscurior TaxID=286306 RepID=A0AAW2GVL7_9HYME